MPIYNNGGSLTVDDSSFSGNRANTDGRAICNNGGTAVIGDSDTANSTVTGTAGQM